MIYLLASVCISACMIAYFKLLERLSIPIFPVIVTNYFVASLCGLITSPDRSSIITFYEQPWRLYAFLMGTLFILTFQLIGISSQRAGISATAVSNKLSLVLPILFAAHYFGELVSGQQVVGIIIALLSVVLTVHKAPLGVTTGKTFRITLPILVFLGSGMVDLMITYIQKTFLTGSDYGPFFTVLFGTAFLIGITILIPGILMKKMKYSMRILIAGIGLGIPNFASLWVMVAALNKSNIPAVYFFPVNNIGVIIVSTILGIALFRDRLSTYNIVGLLLAVVAILLMQFDLSSFI